MRRSIWKSDLGFPKSAGMPIGDGRRFAGQLAGDTGYRTSLEGDGGILIIHEQVMANALREEILAAAEIPVAVGSVFGLDRRITQKTTSIFRMKLP